VSIRDRDNATFAGLCLVGLLTELLIILVGVRPPSLVAIRSPIDSYDPIAPRGLALRGRGHGRNPRLPRCLHLGCTVPAPMGAAGGDSVLGALLGDAASELSQLLSGHLQLHHRWPHAWLHGLNPIPMSRMVAIDDPLFYAQHCCAQYISPYGPTWQWLLILPTKLAGDGFVSNTIAFRAISIPFLVGSAYLAARIAQNRAPRYAAAAAILVGWSPLILWEIAVNGHNDMVMTVFALFALERADRRHWSAALPLLTSSVLAKYVSLMLAPLLVLAALAVDGRRAVRSLIMGGVASLVVATVLTASFWTGPSTFLRPLFDQSSLFSWSPAWLLATILRGNQPLLGADAFSSTSAGQAAKDLGTWPSLLLTVSFSTACGGEKTLS
jgi:hypothetical protein